MEWTNHRRSSSRVVKRKWVPKQEREQQQIRNEDWNWGMNSVYKVPSSQPLSHILYPLFLTPLGFFHSFGKNQRRGLLEWALGPPRRLRLPKSGDPFEKEREAPWQVKRREGGLGLVAEYRWVVPIEVAWDLGGDEQLRVERWCGCGVR